MKKIFCLILFLYICNDQIFGRDIKQQKVVVNSKLFFHSKDSAVTFSVYDKSRDKTSIVSVNVYSKDFMLLDQMAGAYFLEAIFHQTPRVVISRYKTKKEVSRWIYKAFFRFGRRSRQDLFHKFFIRDYKKKTTMLLYETHDDDLVCYPTHNDDDSMVQNIDINTDETLLMLNFAKTRSQFNTVEYTPLRLGRYVTNAETLVFDVTENKLLYSSSKKYQLLDYKLQAAFFYTNDSILFNGKLIYQDSLFRFVYPSTALLHVSLEHLPTPIGLSLPGYTNSDSYQRWNNVKGDFFTNIKTYYVSQIYQMTNVFLLKNFSIKQKIGIGSSYYFLENKTNEILVSDYITKLYTIVACKSVSYHYCVPSNETFSLYFINESDQCLAIYQADLPIRSPGAIEMILAEDFKVFDLSPQLRTTIDLNELAKIL